MKSLLLCIGLLVSSTFASIQLTPDNIKLKTAQGNWFVLYSNEPSPAWTQLAAEHKDWKQHGVYFGHFESSHDTTIQVYRNGESIITLPGTDLASVKQHMVSDSRLRGSVVLTKDWLDLVQTGGSPWLVKFYAPWCGHCKKLAPIWDILASALETTHVNLAEVNCETDRDLCSSQKVAGLPTLKFYHGGASFEYAGDRTLEHLQQYVTKMTGPATVAMDVSSLASLYTHPVALLHTHSKDDRPEMIQAVAAKFLDSIPFYTTADPKVNTALNLAPGRHTVLIKGDLQQVYTGEKDDEQAYIDWVRDNKYPLVTRIDSSNAKEILKGDRWVVLMVVGNDMAYEPFHAMARLTPGVLFAELNGQAWQSYVKRVYGITTFPTLLLVDPKSKRYFNQDLEQEPFTTERPDAVFEALQRPDALIGHTTEPPRSMSTVQKMVTFVGDHALVFGIGLLGFLAVVVTLAISTDQQDDNEAKKKKD